MPGPVEGPGPRGVHQVLPVQVQEMCLVTEREVESRQARLLEPYWLPLVEPVGPHRTHPSGRARK